MTRNGIASVLISNPAALSEALLAAETTGKLPAEAWPALRSFLLQLAEVQAAGDAQRVAAQIEAAIGPLRQVIMARQALTQAQHALSEGYTSVTQSASDPAQLAEAAAALAALADDVAGRAQQLAALLQL
jgi:hypothetical protein